MARLRPHRASLVMLFGLMLSSEAGATPRSALVMAGGAAEDSRIYEEIIRLAGGGERARIGIITASSRPESQDPHAGTARAVNAKANGAFYVERFRQLGVRHVEWIPIDLDQIQNNADPSVLARVRKLNAVFFGGGQQSRYLTCLQKADGSDSPVLAEIRRIYKSSGMVIAGTSAGTAVQVERAMITGGESKQAVKQGRVGRRGGRDELTYDAKSGLGFFGFGVLDTHFSERGRQGRVLRLAAESGTRLAFGVDEDTALVVSDALGSAPKMKVVGKNGVQIFDLARAKSTLGREWRLSDVQALYLTHGDRYTPSSGKVRFARWKQHPQNEPLRLPNALAADVFSDVDNRARGKRKNPSAFAEISARLAASSSEAVVAHAWQDRGVRVRFSKRPDTRAAESTRAKVKARSYHNLRVDIRARRR